MEQKRVTFQEVVDRFTAFNKENGITYGDCKGEKIFAVVVFKQSNFTKPYTVEQRSYRFNNLSGKAFFNVPSGSRSIVADCLDGTDNGVRIDRYHWYVEYCYFEEVAE